MTDTQIITIAITVLAVLAGTLFNNVRISDLSASMRSNISDTKELLRAEIQTLEARMEIRFNSIDRKLDEILRIVGDHETRITALETKPH